MNKDEKGGLKNHVSAPKFTILTILFTNYKMY